MFYKIIQLNKSTSVGSSRSSGYHQGPETCSGVKWHGAFWRPTAGEDHVWGNSSSPHKHLFWAHHSRKSREEESMFSGNVEMLSIFNCADWEVE